MTFAKTYLFLSLLVMFLPGALHAQEPTHEKPQAAAALSTEQYRELSVQIRRIHREIAALRADLDEPDLKDVFGGIGYILGLCGAAALVAAWRRERQV